MKFYYVTLTGVHKHTGKEAVVYAVAASDVDGDSRPVTLFADLETTIKDTYDFSGMDRLMVKDAVQLRTFAYVLAIKEKGKEYQWI